MTWRVIIIFFGLVFAVRSQAALIGRDWKAPGDELITYDERSGLEWLDLTESKGRSVDDILGNDGTDELSPVGDFAGWRYATVNQVMSLLENAGVSLVYGVREENYAPIKALQDLIGVTEYYPTRFQVTQAFTSQTGTVSGGELWQTTFIFLSSEEFFNYGHVVGTSLQPRDTANPFLSSFLIRGANQGTATTPATITLMILGFTCLGYMRRAKSGA